MTTHELGCIFCSIIEKKIPANIILENERVLAFHDINPAAKLHVLIIPKCHVPTINDVTKENASVMADMTLCAGEIAKKFGVDRSGYRLVVNTERGAGQTVFHLHLHLLAGREFSWPPG